MNVPAGHSEVRAETVSKVSGRPACCAMLRWGREREKEPQWAHLWIILANCVHFSLHSTLGLSSKHKEEIKSTAAMLFY